MILEKWSKKNIYCIKCIYQSNRLLHYQLDLLGCMSYPYQGQAKVIDINGIVQIYGADQLVIERNTSASLNPNPNP